MGDTTGTLNDAGESSTQATPTTSSEELVSTVEMQATMDADADPEGANNTEAEGKDAADKKTGQEGESTDPKAGIDADTDTSTRFDKHPRFVELNNRLKAAEALITKLQDTPPPESKSTDSDKPETLPFKDINAMSDEEILDWQSEDPKGYVDNLQKMVDYKVQQGVTAAIESKSEADKAAEVEGKVNETYAEYAKDNPDFTELWESGKLSEYMDSHPGHTPLSAHMVLTSDTRQQKAIDDAVKKALKDSETARRSTQKTSTILGAGPSSVPPPPRSNDAELKNPKKYGGATSVLAARLARMRQANG